MTPTLDLVFACLWKKPKKMLHVIYHSQAGCNKQQARPGPDLIEIKRY